MRVMRSNPRAGQRRALAVCRAVRFAVVSAVLIAVSSLGACTGSSDVSRQLGARCETHDDCDDMCLAAPAYPDGFCSVNCNTSRTCPARSACVDIDQGICLFTCTEQTDCDFLGAGWQCSMTAALPEGEIGVCTGS